MPTTVGSPATAKNVLAVGAARSVPHSGSNYYYEPRDIIIDYMIISYMETGVEQNETFRVLEAENFGGSLAAVAPGLGVAPLLPWDLCASVTNAAEVAGKVAYAYAG